MRDLFGVEDEFSVVPLSVELFTEEAGRHERETFSETEYSRRIEKGRN